MKFSATLIETLKKEIRATKDAELVELIPHMTKGNLSQVKSGDRKLTEEQALYIADVCALDVALVLVELAAESAKSEKAQSAWNELAKKLRAASSILLLAAFLPLLSVSGLNAPLRLKSSP